MSCLFSRGSEYWVLYRLMKREAGARWWQGDTEGELERL